MNRQPSYFTKTTFPLRSLSSWALAWVLAVCKLTTVALADTRAAAAAGELPVHDLPWFSGDELVHRQKFPLQGAQPRGPLHQIF